VVLHCIDALDSGGAERVAVELANSLDPDSFAVTLCATRRGGPLEREVAPHVDLVVLGRCHRWDIAGMARLWRVVREREVAIVHSHGRGTTRLIALSKLLAGIRVLHVSHDHNSEIDLTAAQLRGMRLATHQVDAHIAVDTRLAQWAVEKLHVPPERVTVVANGIHVGRFRSASPTPWPPAPADDVLRVAVVANLREGKGHHTLLRAVAGSRHRARLQVGLIGAESEPAYASQVRRLVAHERLSRHVWFAGSRSDVAGLLAGAHIGALASLRESGPLALAEYMASGLPFVVTNVGQLTREVKNEACGFVVAAGDVVSFRDALDRLADLDEAGRRALGARGRLMANERFSHAAAVAAVERVYRSLLGP
jgi:glycosyltransferase involved in cell wall biosynthesis